MTLQQLADAIGYNKGYLSKLERGESTNPSLEFVEAVCTRLGVSRMWIEKGEGDPFISGFPETPLGYPAEAVEKIEAAIQCEAFLGLALKGKTVVEHLQLVGTVLDSETLSPESKTFWTRILVRLQFGKDQTGKSLLETLVHQGRRSPPKKS